MKTRTTKRIPIVIPRPSIGKGKTLRFTTKKGCGRTSYLGKQTPFVDIDGEVILVGDSVVQMEVKNGRLKKELNARPMKVCFGEYKAGSDDFGVDYICYGFHVEFYDKGLYSLTQEGKGHSVEARTCRLVKRK